MVQKFNVFPDEGAHVGAALESFGGLEAGGGLSGQRLCLTNGQGTRIAIAQAFQVSFLGKHLRIDQRYMVLGRMQLNTAATLGA